MVNLTPRSVVASLKADLTPFPGARRIGMALNGRPVETLLEPFGGRRCRVGPLALIPGDNTLLFKPHDAAVEEPRPLRGRSRRLISLAVGGWRRRLPGEAAETDACRDGSRSRVEAPL